MATTKKPRVQLTDEQKLELAVKKVQQLKDLAELKKMRVLKNASAGSSANDTRQKILIGAFVKMHFSDMQTFAAGENRFIDFLKRDDDRALFGFAPLPKTTATDGAKSTETAKAEPAKKAAPAAPDIRTDAVFLTVKIEEKDAAKALGARWDGEMRKWFVPAGVDLTPFKGWLS